MGSLVVGVRLWAADTGNSMGFYEEWWLSLASWERVCLGWRL
jgi:hypothetical protein